MTRYGYARVSTKDQKLDRQIEALVNAGVSYGHIYKDKVTGAKDGDRTQQKRLFKKMKAGDEVVVESWERLTRSTRQLLNYDLMFRNLGVKLTSLKQPVDLDTAFGRFVLGTHACTASAPPQVSLNRLCTASSVNADWWASGNEPIHRFVICLISSSAAALLYESAVFLQLKPCVNA